MNFVMFVTVLPIYLKFQHLAFYPPTLQGPSGRGCVGTEWFLLTLFCENANKVTVPLESRGTVKMLTATVSIDCRQARPKWLLCWIKVGIFAKPTVEVCRGKNKKKQCVQKI